MADIFLSYVRSDAKRAKQVADALSARGWSVWWDVSLTPGVRYRDKIAEELHAARCVVVLWSKASIASDFVIDEAEDGKRRGVLVHALIEDVLPPHGFRQIQAALLLGWDGGDSGEFERFCTGILAHAPVSRTPQLVSPTTPVPPLESPPQSPSSKQHGGVDLLGLKPSLGSGGGALGDDRFRQDLFWLPNDEELGFIKVEAGPFTMGSSENDFFAREDEKPQHSVHLPEFWIARYPVTVAQFAAFVAETGYPIGDRDSLRGVSNHPVVEVSWHEALAYCRWLTEKLRSSRNTPAGLRRRLESGWIVVLPSEAEWEKAARGTDGRIYPWGNTFDPSKVNGWGSETTSAVGLSPSGASPCGALDMSGNVGEWMRSLWGTDPEKPSFTYPYQPDDGERERLDASDEVSRVVRGGSFGGLVNYLRAAYRNGLTPDHRNDYLGCRVVSSRFRF